MSSETPNASHRPGQVTAGSWAVAGASLFLVLSTFESLGGLHTLDTRDQLRESLDSGTLQGMGISLAQALDVMRWSLYVTAVAAAVSTILGVFAFRGDRGARIALSIAAVPIILATPITGSFLGFIVAAGAAVLWSQPARDWFAGRPITRREPPAPQQRQAPWPPSGPGPDERASWAPPAAGTGPWTPDAGTGDQPRATPGWGSTPDASPSSAAPAYASYPPPTPYGVLAQHGQHGYHDDAHDRPSQVRTACLVTWVFTGLTGLAYLVLLVAATINETWLVDQVKRSSAWDSSFDDDVIVSAAVIGSIVFLIWCAAAAVVAVFAYRGAYWAWVTLLVSTGLAVVVALLVFPISLVHLAALALVAGALMSPASREWFRSRRRPAGAPPRR